MSVMSTSNPQRTARECTGPRMGHPWSVIPCDVLPCDVLRSETAESIESLSGGYLPEHAKVLRLRKTRPQPGREVQEM